MISAEKLGFLWDLLVATGSPAGVAVNLTILLLLLTGLVDVVVALRQLRRERKILRQAGVQLAMAAREGVLGGGEDVVSALGIPRNSMVCRRVERVLQLRGAGLRHSGMLRELTDDRLAGYGALARYISAILTLLGLLGTVLGLSFALFNIQEALGKVGNLSAFPELIRALGQTLLGMRTAFACTMAGLVAALLLSACNHVVSRLQARVSADLEELVSCDLLVALERVDPDADEAAHAFAQLLVEAGQQLNGLRDQVTAAAGAYEAAGQLIAESVRTLGEHVESLGRSVSEISTGQKAVADAARDTAEALRTSQKAYEGTLDQHMKELRSVVAQNQERVTELATTQSSALESFADLVLDVRAQLARPAESHQQLRAGIETALAELKTAVTQLVGDLAEQQKKALEAALTRKAEALQQMKEQSQEGLYRLVQDQKATLEAFTDLVLDLRGQTGPPPAVGNGRGRHTAQQVRL
ncbi:MAG TPA: MotA/TolQ/ExbB proton channel family protein [Thermoanaerobaculia bacterium]|nr:MotA/TolQ/ExbB proton channel family protein [Thermoanaerobaculia bacterium]